MTAIKPGFYDVATSAGVETLIATPCYGAGNWTKTAGYLRLKAAGTVQVRVWFHDGTGWQNLGLSTLHRDDGCHSWNLHAVTGAGGSFLVQRVKLTDDAEAAVELDACIEEIPV